jgi:hypothetical protein
VGPPGALAVVPLADAVARSAPPAADSVGQEVAQEQAVAAWVSQAQTKKAVRKEHPAGLAKPLPLAAWSASQEPSEQTE